MGIWVLLGNSSNISKPAKVISMARGLVGSRLMRPLLSSLERCPWTVEVDDKPTALQISRTVGG